MGYALRPGITWCKIGDRFLFLDIVEDRYFCLSYRVEACFARLIAGAKLDPNDAAAIARLRADRLLVPHDAEVSLQSVDAPESITSSLLDATTGESSVAEMITAALGLARATASLKILGLQRALHRFVRRKQTLRRCSGNSLDLCRIACAFHRTSLLATPLDRCLARSLAVAHRCLAGGFDATFVMAVKLQPFGAHCWVQHQGLLINDRVDNVRTFTPILVL